VGEESSAFSVQRVSDRVWCSDAQVFIGTGLTGWTNRPIFSPTFHCRSVTFAYFLRCDSFLMVSHMTTEILFLVGNFSQAWTVSRVS